MKYDILVWETVIVGTICLMWFGVASADINLDYDECVTVDLWNSSSNSTYSETICAPGLSCDNYTLDINVAANGSYSFENGSCHASVNVEVPPVVVNNTVTVTETLYGEVCDVDVVLGQGENYTNTEGPCNITVDTKAGYWCPACPEIETCSIEDTIYPEGNTTFYKIEDGVCNVDLRIAQCEPCTLFNIPANYSAIPDSELDRASKSLDLYADCAEKLAEEIKVSNLTKTELEVVKEGYCPLDDDVLLSGWESLANFEKNYLDYFIKVETPVDYLSFSDLISPNGTGQSKLNIDFYAGMALEKYEDVGFATPQCRVYFDSRLGQNGTICYYLPAINEVCINKTKALTEIKKQGWSAGTTQMFIGGVVVVILWLVMVMLAAKAPFMPYR